MTGPGFAEGDAQGFLGSLLDSVTRVLPDATTAGTLVVDRERSLGDRLAGRAGTITGLRLNAPGEALTLRLAPGPRWSAEVARVSGGVIIARRALPVGEWLTAFAGRVAAIAADEAGDAAGASRALRELGIQPAGADIRVAEASIPVDLSALPARLTGRVPEAAIRSVAIIVELLIDTLSRVEGSGETEFIVRRTATSYLPDTLRAYLSLPAEWATTHVFGDGSTPEQALVAQLAMIESAIGRTRNSAIADDASALIDNGRFLTARFAPSSLDLP